MYGASSQSNPMYHPSMMPVYVSNVGHSSVSPNMMAPATMMNSMATSSQMYQQQTGMPSSSPLIHSSQWSAGSTSSLPNSFADHHHQPQYHMTGNHSTVMTAPYNSNTINSGANLSNGMMHRNNTAQSSSGSLFATPPIAAHSFSSTSTESSPSNQLNQATSNGSINRSSSEIPLFQDLDPLSKNKSAPFTVSFDWWLIHLLIQLFYLLKEQKSNKIPESKFPLQQQSFDSFSRNVSTIFFYYFIFLVFNNLVSIIIACALILISYLSLERIIINNLFANYDDKLLYNLLCFRFFYQLILHVIPIFCNWLFHHTHTLTNLAAWSISHHYIFNQNFCENNLIWSFGSQSVLRRVASLKSIYRFIGEVRSVDNIRCRVHRLEHQVRSQVYRRLHHFNKNQNRSLKQIMGQILYKPNH